MGAERSADIDERGAFGVVLPGPSLHTERIGVDLVVSGRGFRAASLSVAIAAVLVAGSAHASAVELVRVATPEPNDLRALPLWVAAGGGFFRDDDLEVEIAMPPSKSVATAMHVEGADAFDAAVVDATDLEALLSAKPPAPSDVVVLASLFACTPFDLIVGRDAAKRVHFDAGGPLEGRQKAARELTIGVEPTQLGDLTIALGGAPSKTNPKGALPADLAHNTVDAIWVRTPAIEAALVDLDGVAGIRASGGEIGALCAAPHVLLVGRRTWAASHRATVVALVRSIGRAETILRKERAESVRAVIAGRPDSETRAIETIVDLYSMAIAEQPDVTVDTVHAIAPHVPPEVVASTIDRSIFDDASAKPAGGQVRRGQWTWWIVGASIFLSIVVFLGIAWLTRSEAVHD